MLRHFLWLIATAAAFVLCLCVSYPIGKGWAVTGIPLPYVAWEQTEGGAWLDFVGGCGTLVSLPVDFIAAVALSVLAWRTLKRRFHFRNQADDPTAPPDAHQPV